MILTIDKYQGSIYALPHAEQHPNAADNTNVIQGYIDRYEREILLETLGVDLYNELVTGLTDLDNAPIKVQDLVKGVTYEVDGVKVIWNGLQDSKSLLIPYVFCKYLMEQEDSFTTFGMERPNGVNSNKVSAIPKYTQAYRDFFKKYQGVDNNNPRTINGRYGWGIDYTIANSVERSLYQFLCDKSEVYTDIKFPYIENINRFGL